MSDETQNNEKPFLVEIAKQGRAVCKKCKQKCIQGGLRIAKVVPNSGGSGQIKNWHHVSCLFQAFFKQRQNTKRIESINDLDGWDSLNDADKADILEKIKECNGAFEAKLFKVKTYNQNNSTALSEDCLGPVPLETGKEALHKDNYFREFRKIVANVSKVNSSGEKINIFREVFTKGSDGTGFKGDIFLWCKLLLPAIVKKVFHLQSAQLIKLFSRLLGVGEKTVSEHLEQSDIGQTIQYFFEQNKMIAPAIKSSLTIHEVDDFLDTLSILQKKDDQFKHFKLFIKQCTGNDLKVIIRLIKHDLRMNAGAKHVFEALHPNAYILFQSCRDIKTVINTCWASSKKDETPEKRKSRRSPKHKLPENKTRKKLKLEDAPVVNDDKVERGKVEEKRKSVPNYFENVKLYLEKGVSERHAEWVRYFIAYGGTVLKSDESEAASHVLHLSDTVSEPHIECSKNARHLIVEWIKDTVAKETLQDWRPYTVRWNPDFK